jgi:tagatose 1,6-diphosphate aldolase
MLQLDAVAMLADRELELVLIECTLQSVGRIPTFRYEMRVDGQRVGTASLRVGTSDYIERYAGHVGYGVDFPHRGKRYAARATRMLFEIARHHGMTILWITCNPENVASRRTIEAVGGELVDIVDVPPDIDLYREGDRQKCRYRVRL